MRAYIALIHKERKSDFGVSFPDFPGCVTAGSTLQEAVDMAAEALELHIEGMAEDGLAIPEPSSIETVMAEPENRDGVAVLVTPRVERSPAVRVNITLPEDTLKAIDAYAERHVYTRSGLIAHASQAMIRGADPATTKARGPGLTDSAKAYDAGAIRKPDTTIKRSGGRRINRIKGRKR